MTGMAKSTGGGSKLTVDLEDRLQQLAVQESERSRGRKGSGKDLA